MDKQQHRPEHAGMDPAEGVRQGTIVLRSRRRRAIFIAGLVGVGVLAVVAALLA